MVSIGKSSGTYVSWLMLAIAVLRQRYPSEGNPILAIEDSKSLLYIKALMGLQFSKVNFPSDGHTRQY